MKNIPFETIRVNVTTALNEDLQDQTDITSELIPAQTTTTAQIIAKQEAILCGQAWVDETYKQLDPEIKINWLKKDSDKIIDGDVVCTLTSDARKLLTGERTALNFLQLLSGTATTTYNYTQELIDTSTKLLDTRKTIPGLRLAQKYAVLCGGGVNHRLGLYDAFLIKDNHIAACGSVAEAINSAKKIAEDKLIEVEVENLTQLKQALTNHADIIMLDNFSLENISKAVTINQKLAKLEVSGDVTIANIKEIAATGVDYISVGALTKNIKAIDFSMLIQ